VVAFATLVTPSHATPLVYIKSEEHEDKDIFGLLRLRKTHNTVRLR